MITTNRLIAQLSSSSKNSLFPPLTPVVSGFFFFLGVLMTQPSLSQSLKHQLNSMIRSLADHSKDYTNHSKDFTRNRKLTFETTLKLLLSMGSQSLSNELLNFFNFDIETPTVSAFTQARNKLKIGAFKQLFEESQPQTQLQKTFKGFHLYAHDGSDLALPFLPNEPETHQIAGGEGE